MERASARAARIAAQNGLGCARGGAPGDRRAKRVAAALLIVSMMKLHIKWLIRSVQIDL